LVANRPGPTLTTFPALGFEEEMVSQAHAMVVSLIPALFIQTINEMIRNY